MFVVVQYLSAVQYSYGARNAPQGGLATSVLLLHCSVNLLIKGFAGSKVPCEVELYRKVQLWAQELDIYGPGSNKLTAEHVHIPPPPGWVLLLQVQSSKLG